MEQYPVHLAAEGGGLGLLRWLVDELRCPLYDEDDQPLRTQPGGDSVLGVASRHKHAHVMRWLVHAKACKVAEIADRGQLLAAVEFLLLLGPEKSPAGGGYSALRSSTHRRRALAAPAEDEEVKQHEAFEYESRQEEEETTYMEEDLELARRLQPGHGLSTRPATATAMAKGSGGGGQRRSGGKKNGLH